MCWVASSKGTESFWVTDFRLSKMALFPRECKSDISISKERPLHLIKNINKADDNGTQDSAIGFPHSAKYSNKQLPNNPKIVKPPYRDQEPTLSNVCLFSLLAHYMVVRQESQLALAFNWNTLDTRLASYWSASSSIGLSYHSQEELFLCVPLTFCYSRPCMHCSEAHFVWCRLVYIILGHEQVGLCVVGRGSHLVDMCDRKGKKGRTVAKQGQSRYPKALTPTATPMSELQESSALIRDAWSAVACHWDATSPSSSPACTLTLRDFSAWVLLAGRESGPEPGKASEAEKWKGTLGRGLASAVSCEGGGNLKWKPGQCWRFSVATTLPWPLIPTIRIFQSRSCLTQWRVWNSLPSRVRRSVPGRKGKNVCVYRVWNEWL